MALKVALLTTPSQKRSGIADYTRHLWPYLREHCDLEAFVEEAAAGCDVAGTPARSVRELKAQDFDRILYQIGNEPGHAFMLPVLRALGGTVVQHDWALFDLARAAYPSLAAGGLRGYLTAVREGGFGQARIYRAAQRRERRFDLPLNRSVVRNGDTFVVHSQWMRARILEERNDNTYISVIPHGAERSWEGADRAAARRISELPSDWENSLLIASFGSIQSHKRIDKLLAAVGRARQKGVDARLILLGQVCMPDTILTDLIEQEGLAQYVHLAGYVSAERASDYLHAVDLCVNLREPGAGGSSGGISRALSHGRAMIASDVVEHEDLPHSCILRVAAGEHEVEELAAYLVELNADSARRERMEAAARKYVDEEAHWSHVARHYAGFLESSPAHRSNRKSLIKAAIHAADAARIAREEERAAEREGRAGAG